MKHTRPFPQKVVGILGGMSDQATMEYYRMLNAAVKQRLGGFEIAETLIAGVNFGNIEHYVHKKDWDGAENYLHDKAQNLVRGGADFLICVSNTMHKSAVPAVAHLNVPFLHIVDPAAKAIQRAGISKVGMLGTYPSMAESFLIDRYRDKHGIEVFVPPVDDLQFVHDVIMQQLVLRDIRPESKARYLDIVDAMVEAGAEGIVLGCTEIFLLMDQHDRPDTPMFNTTELHVEAIADFAVAPQLQDA